MNRAPGCTCADPGTCGCCAGIEPLTPSRIESRPGLDTVAYRIGVYGSFKQTMLARLSAADDPALAPLTDLTTRRDDDFSIGLIDAWATVADVLTFYSERIANENYLRTATERQSLAELARLIGYEPRPGVAANCLLAFTIEDTPDGPEEVLIPAGTAAQSVPRKDELPQTFETTEPITAQAQWNAMRPQPTRLQTISPNITKIVVAGTNTRLRPGDPLLVVTRGRAIDGQVRRIVRVTPVQARHQTTVELAPGGVAVDPLSIPAEPADVYAFRTRAALFGHNAPDWRTMSDDVRAHYVGSGGLFGQFFRDASWGPEPVLIPEANAALHSARFFDPANLLMNRIDAQIDFGNAASFRLNGRQTLFSAIWTGWLRPPKTGQYQFKAIVDDGVRLVIGDIVILNSWNVKGSTPVSGLIELEEELLYQVRLEYFQWKGGAILRLFWTPPGGREELIPTSVLYPSHNPIQPDWPDMSISRLDPGRQRHLYLDALYPGIRPDSIAILSSPSELENMAAFAVREAAETGQSNFTLSARITRLTLGPNGDLRPFDTKIRETTVYAESERLTLAEVSLDNLSPTNTLELDRRYDGLRSGQRAILTGTRIERDGPSEPTSEVITLERLSSHDAGRTRLHLESAFTHTYDRETVTINANVAPATHGETFTEVLGGGDAGQAFQRFALRQAPLTYVGSEDASGAASTLELRVDDIRWHEVPSLYGRGPDERVYVTRTLEDGRVEILFGDGHTGTRLPAGMENVRVRYRRGIGGDGLVAARQIRQLSRRPLGVRGVINPLPSADAQDPENRDELRRNASLTILTLDRLVSLTDYEDFARAFAGIAKALATWSWNGERRTVCVTVAGTDGDEVAPNGRLFRDLLAAMRAHGEPHVPLDVLPYRPARFRVTATLTVHPDYRAEAVLEAVRAALRDRFSFAARELGQAVVRSEVMATMHAVPGVIAVDLDALYRAGPDAPFEAPQLLPVLVSEAPRLGIERAATLGAELLRIDPNGVRLGVHQ